MLGAGSPHPYSPLGQKPVSGASTHRKQYWTKPCVRCIKTNLRAALLAVLSLTCCANFLCCACVPCFASSFLRPFVSPFLPCFLLLSSALLLLFFFFFLLGLRGAKACTGTSQAGWSNPNILWEKACPDSAATMPVGQEVLHSASPPPFFLFQIGEKACQPESA